MIYLLLLLQSGIHPFFEADEQNVAERLVLNSSVEHIMDFTDFEIYQPNQFAVSDDGLFVSNQSTNNLYYVPFEGDPVPVGEGRGRGPFEFASIGKVFIHGEHVWAVDMNNKKITGFNINDYSQFEEHSFSENVQTAYVSNGKIIKILSGSSDRGIFLKKDLNNGQVQRFFPYTSDQSLLSMQFQGSLFYREDKICYVAYLANILKCYDNEFDPIYSKQTIDGSKEPELEYVEKSIPDGVVRGNFMPRGKMYTIAKDVSDDTIFHAIRDEVNDITYIDMYSLDSGVYTGSLRFDTISYSNMSVIDNNIYLLERDDLANNIHLVIVEDN